MIPVIALIGRPNVGKSTLFNHLTHSRDALVANVSGLTRDRKYGEGKIGSKSYIVIDTGGISGNADSIDAAMAEQSLIAINEADFILFIVDARAGLTPTDEMIASYLRKQNKNYQLVMNKTDTINAIQAETDFAILGFNNAYHIAAIHGLGVKSMIDSILKVVPLQKKSICEQEYKAKTVKVHGIKIGIIGRPNVGKSTLVNRLLREERVIVYNQAGTTRDSIYIPYERYGRHYTLIDTAGIRRRSKVYEVVEKFSVIKTLQAIEDAHVIILILDAQAGILAQDLHLLGIILDMGRALVIVINKWDIIKTEKRKQVKNELSRRLKFINFVRIHMLSAKYSINVDQLYESVNEAYECATKKLSTNQLTSILRDVIKIHQPPMVQNHQIKFRYCHIGAMNPPTIIIHGNRIDAVPVSYRRYLENIFCKILKIIGTPIRIEFRSSNNPFIKPNAVHKKKKKIPIL